MTARDDNSDNYQKYRGKCLEMSQALAERDPTLKLVRGHYICPIWGKQPHWWCVKLDGTIIDPTILQFPSGGSGMGKYVEFDGWLECAQCGEWIKEAEADVDGRYAFCSNRCHGLFVGVYT